MQLSLDAQQSIVLGDAVGTTQGASLDLPGRGSHRQVGNGGIFGFAGAMGNDCGIAGLPGHGDGIQGLAESADLVELNENGIGDTLLDTLGQDFRVGNKQVVPDQLQLVTEFFGQHLPTIPVTLVHAVFDADNGMAACQVRQVIGELTAIVLLALTGEIVDAIPVKLRCGAIQGQGDVGAQFVTRAAHRLGDDLQGCLVGGQVGGETALIAHRGTQAPAGQYFLELVEYFGPGAQRLGEGRRRHRQDHELLDVDIVVGVLAAVDDIHHRYRHGQCIAAVDLGDVPVQGQALGLGRCPGRRQGGRKNGIGAEFGLVVCAVGIDHELVQAALVGGIPGEQQIPYRTIDVGHCLQDALAQVAPGVAVAQFQRLAGAGGGTGGCAGAAHFTAVEYHVGLYRGITP